MLKYTLVLLVLIANAASAATLRFEATQADAVVQAALIEISANGLEAKISMVYKSVEFKENADPAFGPELSWTHQDGTMNLQRPIRLSQIPAGVELPGVGLSHSSYPGSSVSIGLVTTGNSKSLDYVVRLGEAPGRVLKKGRLILKSEYSEEYRKNVVQNINRYSINADNPEKCKNMLGVDCATLAASIKKYENTLRYSSPEPFGFLPKEWRLPQFGELPPAPASNTPVVQPPPFIQLQDEMDFPKVVELATIICKDKAQCPQSVGLLLILNENKQAAQCTTEYWHQGGWFSTNAHCIPADLRNAAGSGNCSGRIFVKLPETKDTRALTLECDKIEYVAPYTENPKNRSDATTDLAYFRVKNPEKLADRKNLTMNFDLASPALGTPIHMYTSNPVKDKEGLNGIIERKSCKISDPLKIRELFPRESQLGYPILYYSDCDINTIGGNSGSTIRLSDEAGIGWHSASNSTFRLGTAARCFAPVDLSKGVAQLAFRDGCDVLSHDRIQVVAGEKVMVALATELTRIKAIGQEKEREAQILRESVTSKTAEGELLRQQVEQGRKSNLDLQDRARAADRRADEWRQERENERLSKIFNTATAAKSRGVLGVKFYSVGSGYSTLTPCVNNPEIWVQGFMENPWFDFIWGEVVPSGEIRFKLQAPDFKAVGPTTTWGPALIEIQNLRSPIDPRTTSSAYKAFIYYEKGHPQHTGSWYSIERCD